MKIIILGHSHVTAIRWALDAGNIAGLEGHTVEMLDVRQENYQPIFREQSLPESQAAIAEFSKKLQEADQIFALFFGNAHNAVGLVNNPEPFDFVYDQNDKALPKSGVEFIPHALIKNRMQMATKPVKVFLKILLEFVDGKTPVTYLENPPTIKSEEHIKKHPRSFTERVAKLGVAPATLRDKLRTMHCDVIREYCKEYKVPYLAQPATTQDADGYFKPELCHNDPTHGNAEYGRLVLQDILENALSMEPIK